MDQTVPAMAGPGAAPGPDQGRPEPPASGQDGPQSRPDHERLASENQALLDLFTGRAGDPATRRAAGRVMLQDLEDLAADRAPAARQAARDWRALNAWLDAKPGQAWTAEQEARFAAAFQAYLRDGRAPSPSVRPVFMRLKSWLLDIYRTLRNLNLEIDPQVRELFDRLLAVDLKVRFAREEAGLRPGFDVRGPAPQGIDQAAWDRYCQTYHVALAAAEAAIARRELVQLPALEKKFARQGRDQARRHADQMLIQSLMSAGGLSQAHVARVVDARTLRALWSKRPGLIRKHGADAHLAAAAHGLTLDRLVDRLLAAPTQKQLVDGYLVVNLTAWAMSWNAADEIISDEFLTLLRLEEALLARMSGGQHPSGVVRDRMRHDARQLVDRLPVERIPAELANYRLAQQRAESDLRRALAVPRDSEHGDPDPKPDARRLGQAREAAARRWETALRRRELYQAQQYLADTGRYLQQAAGNQGIDPGYRAAIRELLDGPAPPPSKDDAAGNQSRPPGLPEFLQARKAEGEAVCVPDWLLVPGLRPALGQMTLAQVRDLRAAVRNLEYLGLTRHTLLAAPRAGGLLRARARLAVAARESRAAGKTQALQEAAQAGGWLGGLPDQGPAALPDLLKVDFMCRALDGDRDNGPWHEVIQAPLAQAQQERLRLGGELAARLGRIWARIPSGLRRDWAVKRYTLPGAGPRLTRQEMIMTALYCGTRQGWAALRDGGQAEGWSDQSIQTVLDLLTPREWAVVRDLWGLADNLHRRLDQAHSLLFGIPLQREEGWTIRAREVGQIQGGYFPRFVEPSPSGQAGGNTSGQDGDLAAMFRAVYQRGLLEPDPSSSPSQGAPRLRLDAAVIAAHLHDAVLLATHTPVLRDARRLVSGPAVAQAALQAMGGQPQGKYPPRVVRAARPRSNSEENGSWLAGHVRRHPALVTSGLRAVALPDWDRAVSQAMSRAVDELGLPAALRGLCRFLAHPRDSLEFVAGRSELLARRGQAWQQAFHTASDGQSPESPLPAGLFIAPLVQLDLAGACAAWLAGFETGLTRLGYDPTRAASFSDGFVRAILPPPHSADLAGLLENSAFQGAMSKFHFLFAAAIQTARPSGLTQAEHLELVRAYWWQVITPAHFARCLAGPGAPDQSAALRHLAAGVPRARYLINPLSQRGLLEPRPAPSHDNAAVRLPGISVGDSDTARPVFSPPSRQAVAALPGLLSPADNRRATVTRPERRAVQ